MAHITDEVTRLQRLWNGRTSAWKRWYNLLKLNNNLAQANIAPIPDTLPEAISEFGILAAKVIVQKSAELFKSILIILSLSAIFIEDIICPRTS